jgi:Peptidase S24-like
MTEAQKTAAKEDLVRDTLDKLIREKGEDYLSISRLLGRNAAYIQQFIRRGVPRKLDEDDRGLLARYFDVDEVMLGAKTAAEKGGGAGGGLVLVPRLSIGASAGPGGLMEDERPQSEIGFDPRWLRSLGSKGQSLSLIQVAGDSMTPTLGDGDDIMVDRDDGADRVRDGIYVLRVDDVLIVKRLSVNPLAKRLAIKSDNPAYPDWTDTDPADVNVIGRVIWAGRKLG